MKPEPESSNYMICYISATHGGFDVGNVCLRSDKIDAASFPHINQRVAEIAKLPKPPAIVNIIRLPC